MSPELNLINMNGFCGMFLGGIYGGILQTRRAKMSFTENSEAVLFDSQLAAQRMLQNDCTVGFGKGALRWGSRCGIFCWMFS